MTFKIRSITSIAIHAACIGVTYTDNNNNIKWIILLQQTEKITLQRCFNANVKKTLIVVNNLIKEQDNILILGKSNDELN